MASSNIKLFDENKGNMLNDTEFNISTQRLNGLQTGVASSQLQNKAMYQASLVAYAIAQVMLQNGKNANDTDAVSTFVANLSGTMLQKVYDLATTAEAQAGVATGKWMSPALVKVAIDSLAAKAQNILSDAMKTTLGLTADAVPNDAFKALYDSVCSFVTVTTIPDTTCVMTIGGHVEATGTADDTGKCVLQVKPLGTYTLTATYSGTSVSKSVDVRSIGIYDVQIISNLEETPWAIIDALSESGKAEELFSLGDTKTIRNGSYTAQIVGFNHDNKTGGGKAGITFHLTRSVGNGNMNEDVYNNSKGWANCSMRTKIMVNQLSYLSTDLQAVIKSVDKLTSAGSQSSAIVTTSDKLFLLSEVELFGRNENSFPGEGTQYAYYAAGNSVGKNANYSERSPYKSNSTDYCGVLANGNAPYHWSPSANLGIVFAFCV